MHSAAPSSSSTAIPAGKVVFETAEGYLFEVEKEMVKEWEMVNPLIANDCFAQVIPLPKINIDTLASVVEFCRKDAKPASNVSADTQGFPIKKQWDDYYSTGDKPFVVEIIVAAKYLKFKKLLDIAREKWDCMTREKHPQQPNVIIACAAQRVDDAWDDSE